MDVKKRMWWLDGDSIPWYLAGGLIPESTDNTVYDPLAAIDLATSYVNLANPGTRDALPIVPPTHTIGSGWTLNGTTQYLDSQEPFLTNDTIVVWCNNWAGVYVCGNTKMLIRPINAPNTRLTISTNTDLIGTSTGSIIGVRAGLGAYKNGEKFADMGAFAGGIDYNTFIGCRNNAGAPANFGSGNVFRYAKYRFKLSDAQMEALFISMKNYELPAVNSYAASILALNPICYYPVNQKYGQFMLDQSGNNANSEAYLLSVGQSGLLGNSVLGINNAANFIQTYGTDWNTKTGINLDEFWFSCLIKNINANAQARPLNIYSNTGNEYFALEIRAGNIAIFSKENAVTWNTATLGVPANNTWQHLVCYNSKSQNKIGIYLNGVNAESAKGTTGFVDTTPDTYFPYICQSMSGYMQHMAFFNGGPPTQLEVDSINPI